MYQLDQLYEQYAWYESRERYELWGGWQSAPNRSEVRAPMLQAAGLLLE